MFIQRDICGGQAAICRRQRKWRENGGSGLSAANAQWRHGESWRNNLALSMA